MLENYTYLWNINGKSWLDNWTMDPRGFGIDEMTDAEYSRLAEINRLRTKAIEPIISFKNAFKDNARQMASAIVNLLEAADAKSVLISLCERFEEIGSEAAKRIIASDDRPTAFVTAYDEIAVSLIYDLEKAGIRVPEDISVFGLNDIPLAPYVKSSLSTVRFFHDEQAALAVDILYDKIFG